MQNIIKRRTVPNQPFCWGFCYANWLIWNGSTLLFQLIKGSISPNLKTSILCRISIRFWIQFQLHKLCISYQRRNSLPETTLPVSSPAVLIQGGNYSLTKFKGEILISKIFKIQKNVENWLLSFERPTQCHSKSQNWRNRTKSAKHWWSRAFSNVPSLFWARLRTTNWNKFFFPTIPSSAELLKWLATSRHRSFHN